MSGCYASGNGPAQASRKQIEIPYCKVSATRAIIPTVERQDRECGQSFNLEI